jgi:arsenite methyltransferase
MSETITEAVKSKYGSVAASGLSTDQGGVKAVAEAFGYTPEELASIPAEANMALSCGNPTATAGLRPGETVVDLGSGGGLDVFLAARKVGPTGKAIGIDMTPEMIGLACRNAEKSGLTNVEFHQATIDRLPLPDASLDCVISNCVINLAPDKGAVFREIARVLKPGGRLAVSDIALKRDLPPELGDDLMAYVGCIAGAIPIEDYRRGLIEAGFAHVEIIDSGSDLNAYAQVENQAVCCPPPASLSSGLAVVEASCCSPTTSLPDLPVAESACCSPSPESSGPSTAESACCSGPTASASSLAVVDAGCCSVGPAAVVDEALHARLADLLRRYDVNDYAASVKVFAVKPA